MTTYLYDTFPASDATNNLCGRTDISTGRYSEVVDIINTDFFGGGYAGHTSPTGQAWLPLLTPVYSHPGEYKVITAVGADITLTCVVDHIVSLNVTLFRTGTSPAYNTFVGWFREPSDSSIQVFSQDPVNGYQQNSLLTLSAAAGAHTIVAAYDSVAKTFTVTVDATLAGSTTVDLGALSTVELQLLNDKSISADGPDPGHLNSIQLDGPASSYVYEWMHHVACTETAGP